MLASHPNVCSCSTQQVFVLWNANGQSWYYSTWQY